jgi:hypothetical protein
MSSSLKQVYSDITAEREAQIREWGGDSHELKHSPGDWIACIVKHLGRAMGDSTQYSCALDDKWRFRRAFRRMVIVATLAVAAVQAVDTLIEDEGP